MDNVSSSQLNVFKGAIHSLQKNESTSVEFASLNSFCNILNLWLESECDNSVVTDNTKENLCLARLSEQLNFKSDESRKVGHAAFELNYSDFFTQDTNCVFPTSPPIEISPSIMATMGFHRNFHQSTDFAFCAGLRSTAPFTIALDTYFNVTLTLCVFGKQNKNTFTHKYLFDPRVPQTTDWPMMNENMFRSGGYISSLDEKVRVVVTYEYDVTFKEASKSEVIKVQPVSAEN